MCTVSFIPIGKSFVFTSNRDEHISRPSAFIPKEEVINNQKIVFPKDPKAGGSWFAISELGVVTVLLNGAFKKHVSKGNYSKSRGLVLLDIVSNSRPIDFLHKIDLFNIEPFTVIVYQEGKLSELRWDGSQKHIRILNNNKAYIWSSATLYDEAAIELREELFSRFLNESDLNLDSIIDFHSNNNEDFENGFIIDRATGLKTFSVTQATLSNKEVCLNHIDLFKDEKQTSTLPIKQLSNKVG
jgi:uncharacterized protein with NRDE domain